MTKPIILTREQRDKAIKRKKLSLLGDHLPDLPEPPIKKRVDTLELAIGVLHTRINRIERRWEDE